jgi:signal transduction histidine kinase
MKLWLKISLIAIIMVTFATSICSLVMLLKSGHSNLELATQNVLSDQKIRMASWSAVMQNETNSAYGSIANRSLARYLVSQYGDSNTILTSGDDVIYNTTSVNPSGILPIADSAQQYTIHDIDGKSFMLAGSNTTIGNTPYTLYVIKDISSVYYNINVLSYQFALINIAVLIFTAALIIALVRWVLNPISTLKQNAALISTGIYTKRIQIIENDEIGELASHFNQMTEAIEEKIQALNDESDRRILFMSALAHELKTPMTAISGSAQTLLHTKLDEEEHQDMLLGIDAECARVERLSQKLMQLFFLRHNGSIALQHCSVSELFQHIAASSAEQLKQRELSLAVSSTIDTLMMDRDLMESLLLNLIDNAGKASQAGDCIELTAQGNTIAVIDYGKGIPQMELDKITQPFYMVDKSRSKKAGGSGLGLAIAEEIAHLHNAHLVFESAPGKGTTVKVVFEHV